MLGSVRSKLDSRAFKYLLAGGSAFTTEYILFFLLFSVLSAQVYVANSLSFCGGLIVSFTLNRGWAFKSDDFHHRGHHQLVMYVCLAICNLLLTNVIIGLLKKFHIDPLVGKIAAMLFIVVWNFFIFRLVIFREKRA